MAKFEQKAISTRTCVERTSFLPQSGTTTHFTPAPATRQRRHHNALGPLFKQPIPHPKRRSPTPDALIARIPRKGNNALADPIFKDIKVDFT